MNILIADDDRSFTQLLSVFLKAKGYSVAMAYDAMQVLTAVLRDPPDAIILDILMPGGSGLHALRRLKASTRTNRIPVAVVSASADPQLPKTVKSLGADEFLPKPLDFEQLHQVLRRLLQTSERPAGGPAGKQGAEPGAALRERPVILETLRAELSRAQREASPIGVIMAEIDNFSRIGEVHGRAAGDLVFTEATDRLRLAFRPYDALDRYEEGKFLIILPGCSGTAAMKKAEKLRGAISDKAMNTGEGAILATLSLGVAASANAKEMSSDLLLRAAEEALERARKAGGNRVELASELTTSDQTDRRKKTPPR